MHLMKERVIIMRQRRIEPVPGQESVWYYPQPTKGYEPLTNYIAIYPSEMDACYVNGELVQPQPGDFYGGWITKNIVGPFKGSLGTSGW